MSDKRSYWVTTFTMETWEQGQKAGGTVNGYRSPSKGLFETLSIGDHVLCYIMGLKKFVALQEVVSEAYVDETPIWTSERFPFRVDVKPLLILTPDTGVPISSLMDKLDIFADLKIPSCWGIYFQRSPRKWPNEDALKVVKAMEEVVRASNK